MANTGAAPIGKAESVVPAAMYVRGSAARGLVINDPLEQEDIIRTSGSGSTRLRFLDDTMLTVGPNAEVRLDKGVFDGSQARTLSIDVVFGAMRFVSGISSRNSYEIRTPIAAIGVRGTVVDIEHIGGRTIVNFVDGSGPICMTATAECRTISAGGAPLAIGPNGFSPATAAEAARMWRRLDAAHLALARQTGRDPSSPSGAAAGTTAPASSSSNNSQGDGNNTGRSNNTSSSETTTGDTRLYVPPPYNQIVLSTNPVTPNPDPLTYLATPASRTYGAANPAFSGTVTGLQNSDVLGNVTTGTLTFSSAATASSNIGTYAIDGSGLTVTSANYSTDVLQALGNATALTIVPATLTYTADPATRAFGVANPTFTGSVTGLQNSDPFGSVTSGTLAFTSPATPASAVGQYPIDGSGLTVTSPNYELTILQAPSNATALTITPAGPAFPSSFTVFRVDGRGGPDLPLQLENQVGPRNGFLYLPASTLTYDPGTNDARSVVLSNTPDPANSPTPLNLTRSTAQSHVIVGMAVLPGQGPNPVPAYFLSSWSDGTVDYSAPSIAPGSFSLGANQAFQTIGWGYPGDLFLNPVSFGGNVLFNFENATPAVWSDGHSAPGTVTGGQVAVAVGTTSLRYGMTGTVNMPTIGTFTMSTEGGIANPTQSSAIGLLSGQLARIQSSPGFGTNNPTPNVAYVGSANACPDGCYANMIFDIIAPGKVAVVYALGDGQNFDNGNNPVEVTGIATFAQTSTSALSPPAGFVSFVDTYGATRIGSIGPASGTLQVTANGPALQDVHQDTGLIRTQVSAVSADIGSVPGILGWERWTAGTFTNESNQTFTIPTNGGLPFVEGLLATNLPSTSSGAPSPGTAVQYSLVGATSPTVTNGSVAPGTLLNTSKIGIDFADLKVGLDMFVGIGGGSYEIQSTGGASTPSSSSIALTGALFSSGGATVPVNVLTSSGSIGCTTGNNCNATVTGFLAGDGTNNGSNNGGGNPNGQAPPYLGLNYSFGNGSGPLSGFVSGAAAFGRNLPVGNAVGYAFSSTEALHAAGTPTVALGSGPAFVIGDTTASGLSLGSINVNNFGNGTYQSFDRGAFGSPNPSAAVAAEQGVVAGILSWERWTSGTVNDQVCCNVYLLSPSQGIHVMNGVVATDVPTTNVTYTYNLVGGTKPTVADGSVAPGLIVGNSKVAVAFGATPMFGVDLNVNINSSNFNIKSPNGVVTPSLPAAGLAASPVFSNSTILTTLTSGSGLTGCTVTCNASINGFLAGKGASNLGILYQFNTANVAKTVSGAAGFAKQ